MRRESRRRLIDWAPKPPSLSRRTAGVIGPVPLAHSITNYRVQHPLMHGEPASWWTPIEWNRRSGVMDRQSGPCHRCAQRMWDVKAPDLGISSQMPMPRLTECAARVGAGRPALMQKKKKKSRMLCFSRTLHS